MFTQISIAMQFREIGCLALLDKENRVKGSQRMQLISFWLLGAIWCLNRRNINCLKPKTQKKESIKKINKAITNSKPNRRQLNPPGDKARQCLKYNGLYTQTRNCITLRKTKVLRLKIQSHDKWRWKIGKTRQTYYFAAIPNLARW